MKNMKRMLKKRLMVLGVILGVLATVLWSVVLVSADGDHQSEIEEGKELVEREVGCDTLSDEQREAIGEYLMEQMHPGEAHELMDQMMGGEGSESLEQMHMQMARGLYCNEDGEGMMDSGMMQGNGTVMPMGMMMNMMDGGNTGGGGMMGNNAGMMGSSLGNSWSTGYSPWWTIAWYVFWIAIIGLLLWLVYHFVISKKNEYDSLDSLTILNRRYASGEITKKRYEAMKREIK